MLGCPLCVVVVVVALRLIPILDASRLLRPVIVKQVQALAPQLNVSLPQWWDVYDSFNVWRTYGVGSPMAAIDNATFAEV